MDPEVGRCGFLHKRGAFVSGWKRRWFTLEGRTLRYYRKQGDGNPAGQIALDEKSLIYRNQDEDVTSSRPFAFRIATHGRTYEIAASSREEMEGWVQGLFL
jgi:RAC serine/threonine-protein kinase